MAAGQCDSAVVVANAGQMLAPGDALGPPTQESQGVTNVVQTFGVIRIIFRLP